MEQVRTTVRMPSKLLKDIEKVRDPQKFPTLSDFVRQAVEHYVTETRRKSLRDECRRLAEEENLSEFADADLDEYMERMAQAEKGEL
ncbi:ribbon-helix-helix domain-containing protein [Pelotomaculum propionicicum]|uniref:Ribbon-helix-helix protein CopG domain-containing protein n=1 Tax=Pelotomaculum propionicicum TaxID=258475 RepID=A0A4Y7RP43_9FIRM|nr:ribbon-helix-helix domain-containing protein [Pelotomaculum propionicicum]TEB10768.1 hypothetical protein Pmgp_02083 [Pelotomaculum propionicicum]